MRSCPIIPRMGSNYDLLRPRLHAAFREAVPSFQGGVQTGLSLENDIRLRVVHASAERFPWRSVDRLRACATWQRGCVPRRLPGHEQPCCDSSPRHVCADNTPRPTAPVGCSARQIGTKHCARVSGKQSAYEQSRTLRSSKAPDKFQPAPGCSWFPRSGGDHPPIRPTAGEPGVCQHRAGSQSSGCRHGSKKAR
jgi:hypothetical protein